MRTIRRLPNAVGRQEFRPTEHPQGSARGINTRSEGTGVIGLRHARIWSRSKDLRCSERGGFAEFAVVQSPFSGLETAAGLEPKETLRSDTYHFEALEAGDRIRTGDVQLGNLGFHFNVIIILNNHLRHQEDTCRFAPRCALADRKRSKGQKRTVNRLSWCSPWCSRGPENGSILEPLAGPVQRLYNRGYQERLAKLRVDGLAEKALWPTVVKTAQRKRPIMFRIGRCIAAKATEP